MKTIHYRTITISLIEDDNEANAITICNALIDNKIINSGMFRHTIEKHIENVIKETKKVIPMSAIASDVLLTLCLRAMSEHLDMLI
jgi:hypothetical protein